MKKKKIKLQHLPCFMGLDMSINGTGICIFDNKKKLVFVEVLEPTEITNSVVTAYLHSSQRVSDFSRYRAIVARIAYLLRMFGVVAVVIENYAFGIRRSKAITKLGELGGILRNMLIDYKIKWTEVTPQSVKKYISGKGACPESVLLLKAVKKWGEEFDSVPDRRKIDATVAYGLGRIAWDLYAFGTDRKALLFYEIEVLDKIEEEKEKGTQSEKD